MTRKRCVVWQRGPAEFPRVPSRFAFIEANRPSWSRLTSLLTLLVAAGLVAADLRRRTPRAPAAIDLFVLVVFAGTAAVVVMQWMTPMLEVTEDAVIVRGGPTQCLRFRIPGDLITGFALERQTADECIVGLEIDTARLRAVPLPARLWLRSRAHHGLLVVVLADAAVPERRLRQALQHLLRGAAPR